MIHRKMTRPRHPANTQTSLLLRMPAPRNCAKFSARGAGDCSAQGQTHEVGEYGPHHLPHSMHPLSKTLLFAWPDSGCL